MPTIDTLPFGPQDTSKKSHAPLPLDAPCPFARLVVLPGSARLTIISKKPQLWITMPYQGYHIKYVVTQDLYNCIGWYRKQEDFEIVITDGVYTCTFTIPGLGDV